MSMQQQIQEKISNAIACKHLNVINESHMHSAGTESHFKVIVVSEGFTGKRLLPVSYTHLTLPTTPYV